jgi:protein-tyrosine phosphatase
MAQGILQSKADAAGLDWQVDSAGTANYHVGEAPHHLSQKVTKDNGVDISIQRGKQLSKEDFKAFDKIYVMDKENYRDAKRIAGDNWDEEKVDFLLNELYPGESREVPDPWYGGIENFKEVYALLDEASEKIVEKNKA